MSKVPQVPQSALEGNTKPPKQSNPKKSWCLTLNNWKPEEYNNILNYLKEDSANEWIIGKEKGEMGTPHLQIYISFKIKKRFEQIKKINSRLHIEASRGNKKQNLMYCSKEGDYTSNCRIPRPLEILKTEDLRPYQQDVINIISEKPEPRKIYWWYGPKEIGKSELLFKICAEHEGHILPVTKSHALSQVFKTHDEVETYVFNLTADESEYQKHDMFSIMEAIKDRMFAAAFGTECNGMCLMNHKHLIVMANQPPDFMKTEIDQNRFSIFKINEEDYTAHPCGMG